jgi:hypothetical protein
MGARCWTRHEDNLLLEGRLKGESFDDIALKIGRTVKACRQRFDKATAGRGRELRDCAEIREGTRALGEAINALIMRMPANDVAETLGKPHLSNFAPFKTSSAMRRLAA